MALQIPGDPTGCGECGAPDPSALVCVSCGELVPRMPGGGPPARCPHCDAFLLGSREPGVALLGDLDQLDLFQEDPDFRPFIWDLD